MNKLNLPGTVIVEVKVGKGEFRGRASSVNVKEDFKELKNKAYKNALWEAVNSGYTLSTIKDDEVNNYKNQSEPYESVLKFLADEIVKTNVEIKKTKVSYVGQKVKIKPSSYVRSKYISQNKNISYSEAKNVKKRLLNVKRENWKNRGYVLVGRDEKGKIKSWTNWKNPKKS